MIPDLVHIQGVPHPVLPPGIHRATLDEIERVFATTEHRRWLFEGIRAVAAALKRAGCRTMYLGGSFVSGKEHPGDFDGCWDATHVQRALLDAVLLDFENERANQKWTYRGEMFIASMSAGAGGTYLQFLQTEKDMGAPVGVVEVYLRAETGL